MSAEDQKYLEDVLHALEFTGVTPLREASPFTAETVGGQPSAFLRRGEWEQPLSVIILPKQGQSRRCSFVPEIQENNSLALSSRLIA